MRVSWLVFENGISHRTARYKSRAETVLQPMTVARAQSGNQTTPDCRLQPREEEAAMALMALQKMIAKMFFWADSSHSSNGCGGCEIGPTHPLREATPTNTLLQRETSEAQTCFPFDFDARHHPHITPAP